MEKGVRENWKKQKTIRNLFCLPESCVWELQSFGSTLHIVGHMYYWDDGVSWDHYMRHSSVITEPTSCMICLWCNMLRHKKFHANLSVVYNSTPRKVSCKLGPGDPVQNQLCMNGDHPRQPRAARAAELSARALPRLLCDTPCGRSVLCWQMSHQGSF